MQAPLGGGRTLLPHCVALRWVGDDSATPTGLARVGRTAVQGLRAIALHHLPKCCRPLRGLFCRGRPCRPGRSLTATRAAPCMWAKPCLTAKQSTAETHERMHSPCRHHFGVWRREKTRGAAPVSTQPPARWWVEMDSNHRSYKAADLQSAPFGHSGIYPCPFERCKDKAIFHATQDYFFFSAHYFPFFLFCQGVIQ